MAQPTLSLPPQADKPSARTAAATDRDVQRATLRDLVNLATQCAATESEVERTRASEIEEENNAYQRIGRELVNKFAHLREETARMRQQASAAAQQKFEQD